MGRIEFSHKEAVEPGVDEVTGQYFVSQTILDSRVLFEGFLNRPFSPHSNHRIHGELSPDSKLDVQSIWMILSAFVNPFREIVSGKPWVPHDVLVIIISFLITTSSRDENPIDRLKRLGDSLFRPGIAKPKSLIAYHDPGYLFQPSIADVIDAIACGNFNKPERLLKANPGLLIQRGTAIGPNGVLIENATPLQAAILSGDKELFELIKGMLLSHPDLAGEFERQRLEIYTRRLTAFKDEALKEANALQALLYAGVAVEDKFGKPVSPDRLANLRERCSHYQRKLDSQDFQTIFNTNQIAQQNAARDLLDSLFEAIDNATAGEVTAALSSTGASWQETEEAQVKSWAALTLIEKINRFRHTLKTSIPNAESLLQEALAGRGHPHRFDWNNSQFDKQDLCWRQVVGSIQALLTARHAHALSNSLFEVVQMNKEYNRRLQLAFDESCPFYHSDLGIKFAIGILIPARSDSPDSRLSRENPIHGLYEIYVQQQQEVFGMTHATHPIPQI